jgi:MFS superfamily sulfate permease-like transporter
MQYLPIAAIIISLLGLLISYLAQKESQRRWQNEQTRLQANADRERDSKITRLETQVELFWKAIEGNVGQLLKSPTHIEKDLLLDKLAHRELNLTEAETLRSILTDEMQLHGRDNGIIAYALIIGRLEQIIYDLRGKK